MTLRGCGAFEELLSARSLSGTGTRPGKGIGRDTCVLSMPTGNWSSVSRGWTKDFTPRKRTCCELAGCQTEIPDQEFIFIS